jgi:putative DNA primase/helicase
VRYVYPWKSWQVWDGKRWAEDVTGEAVRRVKWTQAAVYEETIVRLGQLNKLLQEENDESGEGRLSAERKKLMLLLSHLLKWEDARAVGRCIDLTRSEPGVPAVPAEFDRDPFLLNVINGTIDLRTGQLRPHRREDLITKLAPVEYDPEAACPLWMKCLDYWMGGNKDLVKYLQRVVGYALTGNVGEQCLWFFYGAGQNGKSTFLGTILGVLGDYAMQAVSDLLMQKDRESHPTERADLFGRRFVATIETEEGKRMAEALMKQLTGGDKVRARKCFKDFFEFEATHKIVLAVNDKPKVSGTDLGVWRRIKLVPWTVTIADDKKDKSLPDKLRAERPGILAWAVAGCLDWQESGLGEPREVSEATAEYRAEEDNVQQFLDQCCRLHADAKTQSSKLLEAYHEWSGEKFVTARAFRKRLNARGFMSKQGTGGRYYWHGIALPGNGPEVRFGSG